MTPERDPSATSGTHRALEIAHGTASMRDGRLLGETPDDPARGQLEALAATLPDLFGTVDPDCLKRLSERLGEVLGAELGEILLLSAERIHVVQPLARRPGVALLVTSPSIGSIGLVLSAVRQHVAAVGDEAEP